MAVKTSKKTPAAARARRGRVAGPAVAPPAAAHALVGLQRLIGNRAVQRLVDPGSGIASGPVPAVQRSSVGMLLPGSTRAAMESSFGHDFGGVRVHADDAAASAARSLGARAFTTGQDIYFGRGQYAPSSPGGQSLLGHELTHVVQQRSGRSPAGGIDTPGDVYEREAEGAARAIGAGTRVPAVAGRGGPTVQRDPLPPGSKDVVVPATTKLRIPGKKLKDGSDGAQVLKAYQNAAGALALRTTHASPGSRERLWSKWADSRGEKSVADFEKREGLKSLTSPDHIIELQLGGADDANNLRLVEQDRNEEAGRDVNQQILAIAKGLGKPPPSEGTVLIFATKSQIEVDSSGMKSTDKGLVYEASQGNLYPWGGIKKRAGTAAAGLVSVTAIVGGNPVTIWYEPDPGKAKVHKDSNRAVSGFELKTVEKVGAGYTFTAIISPAARVPFSKANKNYALTLPKDGGILEAADNIDFAFPFLSEAHLPIAFAAGKLKAEGSFKPTVPLLKNLDVKLKVEDEALSGGVSVPKDKLKEALPVPGLEITETSVAIAVAKGQFTATGVFALKYSTVADARAEVSLSNTKPLEAVGTLNLHVPGIDKAEGKVWYRAGKLGGSIHIGADKLKIPGVKSASLDVLIQDGALTGEGVVDLAVPGVKQAKLGFGVDKDGNYLISGTAVLAIPGTKEATLGLTYKNGELEGSAHVGLNVPGLESATFDVLWKKGALTGSGALSYKKGKLSGTVNVALSERHKLSGAGELAYEIAPGLVAFAGVQIKEDGSMKVSGGLRVPETVDIFPRKQVEKTLFKLPTIEIPILAIPFGTHSAGIVATIDASLIARAGVGPGQLRKVKLTAEFDPARLEETFSFKAAAELHVPADAEIALQIAGGIGVSLAIVRAVGGIEAEGAAGLQAEFVAAADLSYEKGQLAVAGKAELTARPKLVFRLKAFVRAEADLFVTTIELYKKEWELAKFEAGAAMKIGVRIPFNYVFGKPFQLSLDQIEFIVPEIKPKELIKELLPK